MCVRILSFFFFSLFIGFLRQGFFVQPQASYMKVKMSPWGSTGPGRVIHTWEMGVRGAILWGLEILNHYTR